MNIKTKSRFMQLFCKHDYQCFVKPSSYGFLSLNGENHIHVYVKCGKKGA